MSESRPDPALHEMDPTGRFSDRAPDYVRYRPSYPAEAIDCALAGLGDPERIEAADVGAGTGISSRLLADRGVRVVAIEPNSGMRVAADPHARVEWRAGSGEATGLPPVSLDLVLVAQAFHWFRQSEAIVEFHRILRPGGRLVLMWNQRDGSDPMTRGYIEAIHAVNGEHPAERAPFDPAVVSASGHFAPARLDTFENTQRLDRSGLLGRATSASYVPKDGEGLKRLAGLLDDLHRRHQDREGFVTLRYRTQVYRAERNAG